MHGVSALHPSAIRECRVIPRKSGDSRVFPRDHAPLGTQVDGAAEITGDEPGPLAFTGLDRSPDRSFRALASGVKNARCRHHRPPRLQPPRRPRAAAWSLVRGALTSAKVISGTPATNPRCFVRTTTSTMRAVSSAWTSCSSPLNDRVAVSSALSGFAQLSHPPRVQMRGTHPGNRCRFDRPTSIDRKQTSKDGHWRIHQRGAYRCTAPSVLSTRS